MTCVIASYEYRAIRGKRGKEIWGMSVICGSSLGVPGVNNIYIYPRACARPKNVIFPSVGEGGGLMNSGAASRLIDTRGTGSTQTFSSQNGDQFVTPLCLISLKLAFELQAKLVPRLNLRLSSNGQCFSIVAK